MVNISFKNKIIIFSKTKTVLSNKMFVFYPEKHSIPKYYTLLLGVRDSCFPYSLMPLVLAPCSDARVFSSHNRRGFYRHFGLSILKKNT